MRSSAATSAANAARGSTRAEFRGKSRGATDDKKPLSAQHPRHTVAASVPASIAAIVA
ncbi:MAG: hypothetical protein ABJL67_00230 [Sulfitobacter sp.]